MVSGRNEDPQTGEPTISQEHYDETLRENQDAFDLTPGESVVETVTQFLKQCHIDIDEPSIDGDNEDKRRFLLLQRAREHPSFSQLVLSHPDSTEGNRDRRLRDEFLRKLDYLRGFVATDGSVVFESEQDVPEMESALFYVRECLGGKSTTEPLMWTEEKRRVTETMSVHPAVRFLDDDGEYGKDDNEDDSKGNKMDVMCRVKGMDIPLDQNLQQENEFSRKSGVNCLQSVYLALFDSHGGIYDLMSMLDTRAGPDDKHTGGGNGPTANVYVLQVVQSTAKCATIAVKLGDVRDNFVSFDILRRLLRETLASIVDGTGEQGKVNYAKCPTLAQVMDLFLDLLKLSTAACTRCEMNKALFFRNQSGALQAANVFPSSLNGTSGGEVILSSLSSISTLSTSSFKQNYEELEMLRLRILAETCRLLTTLCRYDDKRTEISTAHENAVEMFRGGIIPILMHILDGSFEQDDGENRPEMQNCLRALSRASMTALRALAVNDEIVRALVAVSDNVDGKQNMPGLLRNIERVFDQLASDKRRQQCASAPPILVSTVALLRNLCGNDEIKTSLCKDGLTLVHILGAMEQYQDDAGLQEHGCATLAAMSLRCPSNANVIMNLDGARCVLTAMRRHTNKVALQRQGALAIRNMIARAFPYDGDQGSDESNIRDALLDLGAESTLRECAGKHRGSVDEAYAALRDLGCSAKLIAIEENGASTKSAVQMFGEVKPRFRYTFEESGGKGSMESRITMYQQQE